MSDLFLEKLEPQKTEKSSVRLGHSEILKQLTNSTEIQQRNKGNFCRKSALLDIYFMKLYVTYRLEIVMPSGLGNVKISALGGNFP